MAHKPRKPLKTTTSLPRPSKPIAKIGKVGKATNSAVAKWKRTQKPNALGYYECYICARWVDYLMAEHVKSKVRSPKDRTNPDNFRPTCAPCNKKKGSRSVVL